MALALRRQGFPGAPNLTGSVSLPDPVPDPDHPMTLLILGLILFIGTHAFTMARAARADLRTRLGEGPYKGIYSLLSLAGIVLMSIGYGQYRASGYIPVWDPPVWTRHLALLLVWFAFVSFAAAYLPGRIKGALKH